MPSIQVETPNKVGHEVTRRLRAEMSNMKLRLLPLPPVSLGPAEVS